MISPRRPGRRAHGAGRVITRHGPRLCIRRASRSEGENVKVTRLRAMIGGASVLGIGVLLALPAALPAAASAGPHVKTFRPGHALYDVGVHPRITAAPGPACALSRASVPECTG